MKKKLVYLSAIMFCCSNVYCMNDLLRGSSFEDSSNLEKKVTQIKKNNEAMKKIGEEYSKPTPNPTVIMDTISEAMPEGSVKKIAEEGANYTKSIVECIDYQSGDFQLALMHPNCLATMFGGNLVQYAQYCRYLMNGTARMLFSNRYMESLHDANAATTVGNISDAMSLIDSAKRSLLRSFILIQTEGGNWSKYNASIFASNITSLQRVGHVANRLDQPLANGFETVMTTGGNYLNLCKTDPSYGAKAFNALTCEEIFKAFYLGAKYVVENQVFGEAANSPFGNTSLRQKDAFLDSPMAIASLETFGQLIKPTDLSAIGANGQPADYAQRIAHHPVAGLGAFIQSNRAAVGGTANTADAEAFAAFFAGNAANNIKGAADLVQGENEDYLVLYYPMESLIKGNWTKKAGGNLTDGKDTVERIKQFFDDGNGSIANRADDPRVAWVKDRVKKDPWLQFVLDAMVACDDGAQAANGMRDGIVRLLVAHKLHESVFAPAIIQAAIHEAAQQGSNSGAVMDAINLYLPGLAGLLGNWLLDILSNGNNLDNSKKSVFSPYSFPSGTYLIGIVNGLNELVTAGGAYTDARLAARTVQLAGGTGETSQSLIAKAKFISQF